MIWKDWRVYAIAAVVGIAGLVYSCNKRLETGSYVQLSDITTQSSDCKSGECGCIKLNEESHQKFKSGLERMVRAGARFSRRQIEALLELSDLDDDSNIEGTEIEQMYNKLLNPDSFMGKLALPYKGPEPVPKLPAPNGGNSPAFYGSEKKLEKYLVALMDENEDCSFSEAEKARMNYKMTVALSYK